MPKKELENLMSQLHEHFGTDETSAEQRRLFDELSQHVHDINEQEPVDPTPLETIELMLEQLGEEHPKTSAVLSEMLKTLKNIGV